MNSVYLPVYYEKQGTMKSLTAPFLFAYGGKKLPIIADTTHKDILILQRKYPVLPYMQDIIMRIDSGEFQVSNDAQFKKFIVIHRITDCSATGKEIILPDSLPPYRYWRFYQPKDGSYCNIADLRFYQKGDTTALKGKIIGTNGHWEGTPNCTKEKVFDDNLLTFFDAPLSSGAWVGMDFGRPINIHRFIYTARGDGNSIDIGDTYELFYWNGNTWTSMGKQKATNIRLTYHNVPTKGLYWLRNLSKGKDERIFTYENEKQIWW